MHLLQVLPYKYQEQVAEILGVSPKYEEIFKRSPRIAYLTQYGPVLPISYRLIGPGSRV